MPPRLNVTKIVSNSSSKYSRLLQYARFSKLRRIKRLSRLRPEHLPKREAEIERQVGLWQAYPLKVRLNRRRLRRKPILDKGKNQRFFHMLRPVRKPESEERDVKKRLSIKPKVVTTDEDVIDIDTSTEAPKPSLIQQIIEQVMQGVANPLGMAMRYLALKQLHQQCTLQQVFFSHHRMFEHHQDLPDDRTLVLGFATKRGLPLPYFPIDHSALCFYDEKSGLYYVAGRQSPFDFFSFWQAGLVGFSTRTRSEKPYLSFGRRFKALMTQARFNKEEIGRIIASCNGKINDVQVCDMVSSNCYSASVVGLAKSLELCVEHDKAFDYAGISSILTVLCDAALTDNFSIGVANNPMVMAELHRCLEVVFKRCQQEGEQADEAIFSMISKLSRLTTPISVENVNK